VDVIIQTKLNNMFFFSHVQCAKKIFISYYLQYLFIHTALIMFTIFIQMLILPNLLKS